MPKVRRFNRSSIHGAGMLLPSGAWEGGAGAADCGIFIKCGLWGDVAWDVVAFYVWIALMFYVYNEVYPIVSRRALLYFLAGAGAAAGAVAALL